MPPALQLLCCAGFAAEVRAAAQAEGCADVAVVPFPATCGRPPITPEDIARRRAPGVDARVVGGACVACTAQRGDLPPDTEVLCLPQCLALVAGEARVAAALARHAYCVTPGWLADWRSRLADMGFAPDLAGECFREFAREVTLFDTGVDPEAAAHLAAFGAALGLPVVRETVGLDLVRAQVANIVLRWRLARLRADTEARHRREAREGADRAAALDMLVRIAKARHETDVHTGIVLLFETLFAPRALHYARVTGEEWEPMGAVPPDVLAQMRALGGEPGWVLKDDGFLLALRSAGQAVAAVAVQGLAFPEYRERYLSLALSVGEVGSLAIGYARRQADLVAARDEAQAANRAKTAFLATMSHELRTPLNGVMGMTDLALRRTTEPKVRDYLATSQKAARHLLAIVNDVLDFAQLEAGHVALDTGAFTLCGLLRDLDAAFAAEAAHKGLAYASEVDPAVAGRTFTGDARRLAQVLSTLVGNAVKFTPTGSVTVRALATFPAPDAADVRFEIEDSGIGIAGGDQARLFRDFEQLDSSVTRAYGGTGLGLAIARRVVRLMGGQIGMQSEAGAGSTFWFTVRLGVPAPRTTTAADGAQALRERCAGAHVLVVDDEPISREVVVELLADAGLAPEVAADGGQAVARAAEREYAAILMDISMPGMDGVEAAQRIRATSCAPCVPIVALTGHTEPADRARFAASGMAGHVAKPVEPAQLYAALLGCLPARQPEAAAT